MSHYAALGNRNSQQYKQSVYEHEGVETASGTDNKNGLVFSSQHQTQVSQPYKRAMNRVDLMTAAHNKREQLTVLLAPRVPSDFRRSKAERSLFSSTGHVNTTQANSFNRSNLI